MFQRAGRHFVCAMVAAAVGPMLSVNVFGQMELAKLTAMDAGAGDNFGNAVAIDGQRAIVGAWKEGTVGANGMGAAYVYRDEGGVWVQEAKLIVTPSSDRNPNDNFGMSVAIDGEVAVVGAWQDNHLSIASGSVYVFRRNDGGTPANPADDFWAQEAKLIGSGRATTDRFGIAVAIEGDAIAIGAERATAPGAADGGAVYIFRRAGSAWLEEVKLNANDPVDFSGFGEAVALSGDHLIVGARRDDSPAVDSGSAYIFSYNGSSWSQAAKLTAFDGAAGDQFGGKVDIDGTAAAIGAQLDDDVVSGSGSVYVYRFSAGAWMHEAKVTLSAPEPNDNFGSAVAIRGDTLAVGAFLRVFSTGAVYIFNRVGTNWNQSAEVFASDGIDGDLFGGAAAVSNDLYLVVGATSNDDAGSGSGAAYIFDVAGLGSADSDGDGLADDVENEIGTDPFDPDTDNDGMTDGVEVELAAGGNCPDPLDADSDNDGLSDGHENSVGPNACNADADGDGLNDGAEVAAGTNPANPDTDGDGLNDGAEASLGTNPLSADSDSDALSDGLEVAFGTNPTVADTDGDGLNDGAEVAAAAGSGCPNPLVSDSDGDGLNDGYETANGTGPCNADSDNDGLSDGSEGAAGTNPLDSDSDDDGLLDGNEVALAAGSGCPSPTNDDSDGDGVTDGNELTAGLGPCDADSDNDGLADGNEAGFGTDPLIADSDADGLLDGTEVDAAMGTGCPNPLNPDSDGDSLSDGAEIAAGSNPCSIDTDGDGFNDAIDPTPTEPGVPPGFLASLANSVAGQIVDLPLGSFLGPNNNVRRARQIVLATTMSAAAWAIENGFFNAATALLTIVDRRIDDESPPPDWMGASSEKSTLHADVEMLIILLENM